MGDWSFLTNHARALLFIAHDPDARLRDLAGALEVTERTAYGIVVDLTEAGYVIKEKDGRRNRYHIQGHLLLRDRLSRERTIGEVLDLLVDTGERSRSRRIPPTAAVRSADRAGPAKPASPPRPSHRT
jgi:DNA-binding IclR family transcriptional regulator